VGFWFFWNQATFWSAVTAAGRRRASARLMFSKICRVTQVDGIMLDLGMSALQLDNPNRGFSFRYEDFQSVFFFVFYIFIFALLRLEINTFVGS